MIWYLTIFAAVAGAIYLSWLTFTTYEKTPGDGLFTAFYSSWKILGARLLAVVGFIATLLSQDASIAATIARYMPDNVAPLIPLAVSALLLWWEHRATMDA